MPQLSGLGAFAEIPLIALLVKATLIFGLALGAPLRLKVLPAATAAVAPTP